MTPESEQNTLIDDRISAAPVADFQKEIVTEITVNPEIEDALAAIR